MSTTTIGLVSLFAGIICFFAAKEPANSSIEYKVPFKREKRGWQLGNSLMGKFLITGGAVYLVWAFILRITDNNGNIYLTG